ncbi:MAG: histidinol dehydrogenase [Acidobacteriota bacterium]|nr:histidinol dehydrogenase [Acidobacteriota bacterium]
MEIVKANNWQRPGGETENEVRETTAALLADIAERGYSAVSEYSLKFDGFEPKIIELKPWREYPLDVTSRRHLDIAAERIQAFAEMQFGMYHDVEREDRFGRYGQRVVPLDSMAAYIPGGRFPLVSTALMTLLPAGVAGVAERVAVSPSDHHGILAAASRAGATKFIHIGGAQAIGALTYGSSLHDPVDMIVGPGNAYVNAAKGYVQDRVKIDTQAGPSEILVLCDDSIDPEWVAFDVLAQAEHDPMALSVLGSTSDKILKAVGDEIERESRARPDKAKGVIQLLHCENGQEMIDLANKMAPEHLHVACKPGLVDTDKLRHYGSLFIGPYSAVALGDYCSGPNHTLPTMGVARQKGGLHVGDFLKILTWQQINGENYEELAETGISMAMIESLEYHHKSLEVRLPE